MSEDRRKRHSEREFSPGQIEEARIMVESADESLHKPKPKKPLKHARSQAELTRVRQGYLLISLNCLNVCIAGLIALKTFGII